MKIALTDSGFGGLGIAAELYEYLKTGHPAFPVEIIYVNGLPHERYGYNSIPEIEDKVNTFGSLLKNIENRLNPDLIVIACNTLSVLFVKTDIYKQFTDKTVDILKFGTATVLQRYKNETDILLAIAGSETTINSRIHADFYQDYPSVFKTILPIACTELITAIERDSKSGNTKHLVTKCVRSVADEIGSNDYSAVVLVLACTHFPYVEYLFRNALSRLSIKTFIQNPNINLLEYLKKLIPTAKYTKKQEITIQIISKTAIEYYRMQSIAALIESISENAVRALHNYQYNPGFYTVDENIFKK